jgi:hypothetical protein
VGPYGAHVGRAAKKAETGSSGRLAAGRRGAWNERKDGGTPPRAAGRGKGGRSARAGGARPSLLLRLFKFGVLLVVMAVVGFSVVLVADVSLKVVGGMKFGQITFAELVDKIEDRFFDRDVPLPRPRTAKAAKPTKAPSTTNASSSPTPAPERAPREAPRAEEYARHVEPRPDAELEAARDRLNELLRKL